MEFEIEREAERGRGGDRVEGDKDRVAERDRDKDLHTMNNIYKKMNKMNSGAEISTDMLGQKYVYQFYLFYIAIYSFPSIYSITSPSIYFLFCFDLVLLFYPFYLSILHVNVFGFIENKK